MRFWTDNEETLMPPRSRPPWLLILLLILGPAAGWVGSRFYYEPEPPSRVMVSITDDGLFRCESGEHWAEVAHDCPEPEMPSWWTEPICPKPPDCILQAAPIPDCICPEPQIPIWNCQDNPCPSDCPDVPRGKEVIRTVEIPVYTTPSIAIGFESDFTEAVCFYDFPAGLIEAARLDLASQIDFVEEEDLAPPPDLWSARLGLVAGRSFDYRSNSYDEPEVTGLEIGLSRRIKGRWGAYLGARWLTDPERPLLWPTRQQHCCSSPELFYFREDEVTASAGVEVSW